MNKTALLLKRTYIGIMIAFMPIMFAGCDGSTSPSDLNLFSTTDDVQLGKQLDDEIMADPNQYPMLNNQAAQDYMNVMLNKILASPDIKYKATFPYQIRIINSDVVNAFAAPGGYLYVYKGLIKFLDNEATLAAVIAHEVAHAERRHATKRMTKHYGVSVLIGLVLGNNPSVIEEIGSQLLTGLAFLKNSRDDEYEADEYSFKYLKTTEWYPGATKLFFNKIAANSSGSKLEELLSTHPLPEERVKAIDDLIKNNNIGEPTEANLFTQRYLQFKNSIPD